MQGVEVLDEGLHVPAQCSQHVVVTVTQAVLKEEVSECLQHDVQRKVCNIVKLSFIPPPPALMGSA